MSLHAEQIRSPKLTICPRAALFLAFTASLIAIGPVWADERISLSEQFPVGYQYHVSTRVELAGTLSLPAEKDGPTAKPLPVTGTSAIEYDERVLSRQTSGAVEKTARIYRRVEFQRKVGDRPQESTIRPAVRRLVVLRHKHVEVPFSPDGPLTWGEIDLVRTDVFTPALAGMLPDRPVKPGDRWTAANAAIQELTDLEQLEEGQVECRLEQVTRVEGRRHARIAFAGTVRGVNEDGPNKQQLDGYFFFDMEDSHLSYLYLHGLNFMLDKTGKTLGQVEGRFVLTRQANQTSRDLADEAWQGISLEPNADNTLLLYENSDPGVRFLYPRRFRVAGTRGRQVALDESNGSGLLITLEPADRVPTASQFLSEVRGWLQQQKGKELRLEPPRRVAANGAFLERFALEADLAGQRIVLEYFVSRQALGGATIAARVLPADAAALQSDLERIARSLAITRPVKSPSK
jgi:hypothetical protein